MAAPLASLENLTKVDLQYLVGVVFNGKVYSELTKAQLADKLRFLIAREQEMESSSETAAARSSFEVAVAGTIHVCIRYESAVAQVGAFPGTYTIADVMSMAKHILRDTHGQDWGAASEYYMYHRGERVPNSIQLRSLTPDTEITMDFIVDNPAADTVSDEGDEDDAEPEGDEDDAEPEGELLPPRFRGGDPRQKEEHLAQLQIFTGEFIAKLAHVPDDIATDGKDIKVNVRNKNCGVCFAIWAGQQTTCEDLVHRVGQKTGIEEGMIAIAYNRKRVEWYRRVVEYSGEAKETTMDAVPKMKGGAVGKKNLVQKAMLKQTQASWTVRNVSEQVFRDTYQACMRISDTGTEYSFAQELMKLSPDALQEMRDYLMHDKTVHHVKYGKLFNYTRDGMNIQKVRKIIEESLLKAHDTFRDCVIVGCAEGDKIDIKLVTKIIDEHGAYMAGRDDGTAAASAAPEAVMDAASMQIDA